MPALSFKFGQVKLGGHEAEYRPAATGGAVRSVQEDDFAKAGLTFSSNQRPDKYMFSRMGGWNVSFRASVIRITFMKLLGTGVAAAFMAINQHTGRYTSFSCAMAAAVNFIACAHYWRIWSVRQQTFGGRKYEPFMSEVGRAPVEDKGLLKAEKENDERLIYFQELTVDGLRHSDCTQHTLIHTLPLPLAHTPPPSCSQGSALSVRYARTRRPPRYIVLTRASLFAVLMTLDLGHLREYLTVVTGGAVPPLSLGKEWLAGLQSIMILFATVYRFYSNEGKDYRDDSSPTGYRRVRWTTLVFAWGSFVISCVVFSLILFFLLEGLPSGDTITEPSIRADIACLQVLTLVWIGYPLVSLAARIAAVGEPPDKMNATISLLKDLSYAFLDVTSKGGMAIFFVLKATWIDSTKELTLIAAANNTVA